MLNLEEDHMAFEGGAQQTRNNCCWKNIELELEIN